MCAREASGDVEKLRAILAAGGELRLAVTGWSMRPILREGDYLVVRPLEGPPRVGEVVVYSRAGHLWAHRLLARSPSGGFMLTKGDARGRPDPPVTPGELIGRAVAVERDGRRTGLEGLASRLAGLAVSLSGPAAALGRRLAKSTGLGGGGRKRRLPAAGFALELSGPADLVNLMPPPGEPRPSGAVDFRVSVERRGAPTTGGRYGLTDTGRGRYTFTSPAVLARIDLTRSECRAALLPGQEYDGFISLLRILSILLTTERGEGLALHASAVRHDGGAYLFCGPGGTGKSTALGHAAEAGAEPLADDLVLLRKDSGRWLAWGPPLERNLSRKSCAPVDGWPVAALLIPARGTFKLEVETLSPARWATLAAVFPPGAPLYDRLLDRLGDLAESAPTCRISYADRKGSLDRLFKLLEDSR